VRDEHPDAFLDVHDGLFAARHDEGTRHQGPGRAAPRPRDAGLDADAVLDAGSERAGTEAPCRPSTRPPSTTTPCGVSRRSSPADRAVFVRVLDRPEGDGGSARDRIETVLDLVEGEPMLHEFKQTDLPV
jgi:hypothetical protein